MENMSQVEFDTLWYAYGYWFWFGLATVLLVLEAIFGRFMFLAASVAGVVVGGLTHFYPEVGLPVQVLFFVVLATVLMWMARSMLREQMAKVARLQALYENQSYVGREFKLISPIEDGYSNMDIDGMVWQVNGPDCAAGSRVKVVEMADGFIRVELVSNTTD